MTLTGRQKKQLRHILALSTSAGTYLSVIYEQWKEAGTALRDAKFELQTAEHDLANAQNRATTMAITEQATWLSGPRRKVAAAREKVAECQAARDSLADEMERLKPIVATAQRLADRLVAFNGTDASMKPIVSLSLIGRASGAPPEIPAWRL